MKQNFKFSELRSYRFLLIIKPKSIIPHPNVQIPMAYSNARSLYSGVYWQNMKAQNAGTVVKGIALQKIR